MWTFTRTSRNAVYTTDTQGGVVRRWRAFNARRGCKYSLVLVGVALQRTAALSITVAARSKVLAVADWRQNEDSERGGGGGKTMDTVLDTYNRQQVFFYGQSM